MKTFDELTPEQQKKAIERELKTLVQEVGEGWIRFDNELDQRVSAAIEKADQMRTPWFAGEYIYEACKDALDDMAAITARSAIYTEPGEYFVAGIAT